MKKNISINISGIIFHIEEDVYERLKGYLESIQNYFSSFDDSAEIIEDIESRIAEIFLSKLNEDKQVIIDEDVDQLIKTMGSIQDFEAVEEPAEEKSTTGSDKSKAKTEKAFTPPIGSKKFQRDGKRKLLGGVAAGAAHYFNIDPLWIRLALAIFVLPGAEGVGVLIVLYVILWAVLPESFELQENEEIKKMFRNPEDKVVGGVASGIAAYFGTDVTIVRLLLVLSIFLGGAGLVLYVILWIITPEANSITDRMQMQGEPVTLSGIETNIKDSLNVKDGEESLPVKILLFPFRMIAAIFRGAGVVLGPILLFLVEAIRVIIGLVMIIAGVSIVFALLVATGSFIGIAGVGHYIVLDDFPLELVKEIIPTWGLIGAFLTAVIPALVIAILGASIITKRTLLNAISGWSLFALFVIGVVISAASIPPIINSFKRDGHVKVEKSFDLQNRTAIIKVAPEGMEDYAVTSLKLRGHRDSTFLLVQNFEAQGKTRKDAEANALMVNYNVDFQDSTLTFDENISFKEDAKFKFQELNMTLYIPYLHPFTMDENVERIILNTIYRNGYSTRDIPNNTWIFMDTGKLYCTTCEDEEEDDNYNRYNHQNDNSGYFEERDLSNVDAISVSGIYELIVRKGEENSLVITGDERDIEEMNLTDRDGQLTIESDRSFNIDDDYDRDVIIEITIESLKELELEGASRAKIRGFDEDEMNIDLSGASRADIDSDIKDLSADITGASKLILSGEGESLTAKVTSASRLDAFEFEVSTAVITSKGAANVKVSVEKYFEVDASGVSNIRYKGDPTLEIQKSKTSTVSKY